MAYRTRRRGRTGMRRRRSIPRSLRNRGRSRAKRGMRAPRPGKIGYRL